MTTTFWTDANRLIQAAQRVIIVTHQAPDGDAIGTMLGMLHALRALGKEVDAAVDGGVPAYLRFLPASGEVSPELSMGHWDVCLSVDASDEARSGACGAYARANSTSVINLDHHVTNTGFGDVQLVVPAAVSAAEVAYDWLMVGLGLTIGAETAQSLLTGIVTDTLGFRTSGVKPRTLQIAQELMAAGGNLTEITARTLDTRPLDSLLIWREALQSLTLQDGVIWAVVPAEAFERLHIDPSVELNLSEFLVGVNEAMVSATFKQQFDGEIRLSMRAKLGFDVGEVAKALGGGGHRQAAGATLHGPLEDAIARVIPMLKDVVLRGEQVIR